MDDGVLGSYPSDLRGPRHHDGVGNCGGQPDQRGNVDGPTGPFGLDTVFGWRKVTLEGTARRSQSVCRKRQREKELLTGRLHGFPLTFTHKLGGKWSS